MPVISKEFKEAVQRLPLDELQKFVLKIARGNKEVYDRIKIECLHDDTAITELFNETKNQIFYFLFNRPIKGPEQRSVATAIGKAIKAINYYVKVTGDKYREAELLNLLLNEVFAHHSDDLGSCWTILDSKLGITTKRLLNLVTKKLHEDYLLDFKDDLNRYLKILHSRSDHIDTIFDLPDKI